MKRMNHTKADELTSNRDTNLKALKSYIQIVLDKFLCENVN